MRLLAVATALTVSCSRDEAAPSNPDTEAPAPEPPRLEKPPRILNLSPDAPSGSVPLDATEGVPSVPSPDGVPFARARRCPPEMVDVQGGFCIDRYEASLVETDEGHRVSPHYPPRHRSTVELFELWRSRRPEGRTELARTLEIPEPPPFQLAGPFSARAVSRSGAVPNGYLSRETAELACRNAGKRLCRRDEWTRACRGQEDRKFPYGSSYRAGVCNVHREAHPAALLHGNASIHHLDPRLPLMEARDGPLLRPAGHTPDCGSRWGEDAVYDMVGNLDEWIDDEGGVFLGGFYSRATREGCDAAVESHSPKYLDYSLGTRCCRDI